MAVKDTVKDYEKIHAILRAKNKKPSNCTKCGISGKRIEWANVTGIYDLDINNYRALCATCHRRLDWGVSNGLCRNGHELKGDNVYTKPKPGAGPQCRICLNLARKKWYAKNWKTYWEERGKFLEKLRPKRIRRKP